MSRTIFLQTYGCQMNERDSEEVLGMLTAQGYERAEGPESADVILLNTCSVREHAEERAFGKMGELKALKQARPDTVLGIIGCMAKLQKDLIFKRLPHVDLVAGPAELYDLPYLLAEIQEKRQMGGGGRGAGGEGRNGKVLAVGREFRPLDRKPQGEYRRPGVTAFVTIMEGCDKRCTYCIVPMTRGQEISRPAEEILEEMTGLVEHGYHEITLLGQNVNSYGKRFPDGSGYKGPLGRLRLLEESPDTLLDFPALLRRIDALLRGLAGDTERVAAGGCHARAAGGESVSERHVRDAERPPAPSDTWRAGARSQHLFAGDGDWQISAGERGSAPSDGRLAGAAGAMTRTDREHQPAADARREDGGPAIRIRFTTSHPFDATPRLFEAMQDCPSVCEWLHLPVQSGSNRILRAMRRGYTREAYLEKLHTLRSLMPDIALTTDIIVGFPGETEEDFQQTVGLMRQVAYDSAFIFKYSPRPGTDAAAHPDDVPREVKEARNQVLLALQDEISLKRFRRFEGRRLDVLIEGPGKHEGQLFGRTRGNHGVIVEGPAELIGQTVPVRIARATAHTLFGTRCPD